MNSSSGDDRGGVLVIQPLPGIGDMVWHLPLIHAIAREAPEGRVTLLTKPRSGADRLLAADPAVGSVLWLERNPGVHDGPAGVLRLARLLHRQHFRRAWILHDSARYALAARLAGIPERIGYGTGVQRYLLSDPVSLPPAAAADHPIRKAERFLELCGIPRVEEEPRLPVDEAARRAVREAYPSAGRPRVALGIGSSEDYKQWGAERFSELAAALAGEAGATVFVVGGPAERTLGERIVALARERGVETYSAIGLPLERTAALLSECDLYVGNDTGVLNMAAAVGTVTIGLFGASEPLWHSRRIHCLNAPRGQGMSGISVEQVMDVVRRIGYA